MFFNRYFVPSFALLTCIALLHYVALDRAYYWTIPWYDIMMHFLGGLWVALFSLWVCASGRVLFLPQRVSWGKVLVVVLVVGLFWEFYELLFGLTFTSDPEYWGDSVLDMVMDTAGGLIGAILLNKNHNV